jgi:hypothetical protein
MMERASWFAACALLWSGCGLEEVEVRGMVDRVRSQRAPGDFPLVGGTVILRGSDGVEYDRAETDDRGVFEVRAPAGETIYAEIHGDGLVHSAFTGVSGLEPKLLVEPGNLHGVLQSTLDELRAVFADCPGAADPGGVVFGEVRVVSLVDPETDEHPLVTTARVRTEGTGGDGAGLEHHACYFGDDGVTHDPESTITGPAGFFAIFGVDPGPHTLVVVYTAWRDSEVYSYSEIWMPDDPGTVDRFPAWVEFPF